MVVYGFLAISLTFLYVGIIRYYRYHWNKLPFFKLPNTYRPATIVSVIIPARNEATKIKACLDSLCIQDYPISLWEVILIDDHSTDDTVKVVNECSLTNLQIFSLPEGIKGKKAALAHGINQASGELILTTDADCIVPGSWIRLMAGCYEQTQAKFIAGPVIFEEEKSSFERFQSLDFMGMMLITGAGIQGKFMHSSNGASLAYPKKVYQQLNGFEGIEHIASGDDILFMQKTTLAYPGQLFFLKNPAASVRTKAMSKISSFLSQRIRWGTKSSQYSEWKITAILALVFFCCWSIILSGCMMFFFGGWMIVLFILQLLVKSIADYYFLRQASRFFGKTELMRTFWSAQFWHIGYIAVVGLLANLVKRYRWKGRKVQ